MSGVMPGPILVFVTPASPSAPLPSRPSALLDAFVASGFFARLVVIHRLNPFRGLMGRRQRVQGGAGECSTRDRSPTQLERLAHLFPFGLLERRFVARQIQQWARSDRPIVLWVADPKSAPVLADGSIPLGRVVRVFDAYDAWDLSPLVRGWWRQRSVRAGYRAAVQSDLICTNTAFLAQRFLRAGARRVIHLPNAAPPVDRRFSPDLVRPYVVYVGRIHERMDVSLIRATAALNRRVRIRIAGPIEGVPEGWAKLASEPNVQVSGPVSPSEARVLVGRASAVIVPHRVDDYTRSQDAMKAWDALAVGTPVVSTSVPPAVSWPPGLALVADDGPAFADAVRRVLDGELDPARELRFAYAAANSWRHRADQAIAAIKDYLALWD